MSGSKVYSVKQTPKFERSLRELIRSAFPKSDPPERLMHGLGVIFDLLQSDPRHEAFCRPEPAKHLGVPAGCELWKVRFDLPGVRGALGAARFVYLICEERREVILVWAYSHKQFAKRPPHKDMKKAIREIAKLFDG